MVELGNAFWALSVDMGIYILFGLVAAGVLHQLVREEWVRKHLGASDNRSVIKAALYGTPLPLCSCSVIPFAASLRQNGASKGATLAFMISTPVIGIDSILATFGMFGWAFTLYRTASSVLIAVAAGIAMNLLEPEAVKKNFTFRSAAPAFSLKSPVPPPAPVRKRFSFPEVFRYGFLTLLGSFAKPLFWGLVAGALITVVIPDDLRVLFGENRVLGYLIAVTIAVPMYVCATASLPVAASLMIAGVSPGAAFVFLSAGPATNTVTMGVVKSMLGIRALIVYLSVIAGGSVMFGALIDWGFDTLSITLAVGSNEEEGILKQGAALVLLGLIAYHGIGGWFRKKDACSGKGDCCS